MPRYNISYTTENENLLSALGALFMALEEAGVKATAISIEEVS